MTWLSSMMACFPALVLALAACAALTRHPAWCLLALYAFPPLAFRLHGLVFELKPGVSFLDGKKYSAWWGGHQIQSIYIAFPSLEAALRLVPGAYSAWLRLWGSRVGRRVYWTPRCEVHDRGLLDLGDGVIFGHKVTLFGHTAKATKGGRILLYVRPVTIGAGAFIGAGTRMAPGVVVEEGAVVPILTDLYPNRRFPEEKVDEPAS